MKRGYPLVLATFKEIERTCMAISPHELSDLIRKLNWGQGD
jgi:hypothetical protein